MKTNFKRSLAVFMAFLFALSLISCGNKAENGKVSSEKKTEASLKNDKNNKNNKDKNGKDSKETERKVTLYFSDENVMYLCPETRKIKTTDENLCKTVTEEVIKGPETADLIKPVSGDVKVLSAKTENKVCTIDLSKEFAKYNVGGSARESMAIYSIVSSLCALDGVDSVKINIDGNSNPDFGGHFSLDEPLTPEETLFAPDSN